MWYKFSILVCLIVAVAVSFALGMKFSAPDDSYYIMTKNGVFECVAGDEKGTIYDPKANAFNYSVINNDIDEESNEYQVAGVVGGKIQVLTQGKNFNNYVILFDGQPQLLYEKNGDKTTASFFSPQSQVPVFWISKNKDTFNYKFCLKPQHVYIDDNGDGVWDRHTKLKLNE